MTKVLSSTATWAEEPGTPEQVVARYVAQGWEVSFEDKENTLLKHPELTGAARVVSK